MFSRVEAVDRVGDLVHELEVSIGKIREAQAAKLAADKELSLLQSEVEKIQSTL